MNAKRNAPSIAKRIPPSIAKRTANRNAPSNAFSNARTKRTNERYETSMVLMIPQASVCTARKPDEKARKPGIGKPK